MVYLAEHFLSVQGEGKYVGYPSIFIRLGGCNLSCIGFGCETVVNNQKIIGCDSLSAVFAKEYKSSWQVILNSSELINIIKSHLGNLNYKPHIVITGGEPLLHYRDSVFLETVEYFIKKDFLITIETNATIEIDFQKFEMLKEVVFAMSVKLSNSLEPFNKRVNFKAIDLIATNVKNSFFKFVLSKEYLIAHQNSEIKNITENYDIPIYCMPLGESSEKLHTSDKDVLNFCIKHGYIYSDRVHIRIFGKKGGV